MHGEGEMSVSRKGKMQIGGHFDPSDVSPCRKFWRARAGRAGAERRCRKRYRKWFATTAPNTASNYRAKPTPRRKTQAEPPCPPHHGI